MAKISGGRVIAGGLLAGLVINLFEWLINGVILRNEWAAAMQRFGLSGEFSGRLIAWFWVLGFLLGISMAWLYAAIRPRFGPGPRTAMLAGLAVWFFVYFIHGLGEVPMGLFPRRLYVITALPALVAYAIAGLAGGWVYKEE